MKLAADKLAGLLMCIGLSQYLLMLTVTEAMYHGFSFSGNYIGDLGVGSTAIFFNASVIILGVCLVAAAYYIEQIFSQWQQSVLLSILGIGAIGIGVFPETLLLPNTLFTLMAFIFGPFAAIYSYKIERAPINYVSLILGLISLAALVSLASKNYFGIGVGGMEYIVLYPIILWGLIFSGYLMSGKFTNT